jgi:thiamine-phosphate pyrophosphorylase
MVDVSASPGRSHVEITHSLLAAGSRVMQLRMKEATDEEHEAVLRRILPLCAAAGAALLLDDRLEMAARWPGVGVHLGACDASPEEARRILGPRRLVGLSTASVAEVRAAHEARRPVDYLGFGPIFSAAGKHRAPGDSRPETPALGVTALREALCVARVPLVAIGGITLPRLASVLATGVAAVAIIGAVTTADDMESAARAVVRAFSERDGSE